MTEACPRCDNGIVHFGHYQRSCNICHGTGKAPVRGEGATNVCPYGHNDVRDCDSPKCYGFGTCQNLAAPPPAASGEVCPHCGKDHRPYYWCSDAARDPAPKDAASPEGEGWPSALEFPTLDARLQEAIRRRDEKLRALESERDAYRKAKQENDERFMIERDQAREERDAAQRERCEWVRKYREYHAQTLSAVAGLTAKWRTVIAPSGNRYSVGNIYATELESVLAPGWVIPTEAEIQCEDVEELRRLLALANADLARLTEENGRLQRELESMTYAFKAEHALWDKAHRSSLAATAEAAKLRGLLEQALQVVGRSGYAAGLFQRISDALARADEKGEKP